MKFLFKYFNPLILFTRGHKIQRQQNLNNFTQQIYTTTKNIIKQMYTNLYHKCYKTNIYKPIS